MVRSSETSNSSELESDHDQEVLQDVAYPLGTKQRSYDCTFCKRGFTNARALGGHMNIHRKERTNKANNSSLVSPNYVPQVSSQPSMYYCMYLQQKPNNPRNHSPMLQYDFLNTRSQSLMRNQELLGTNLSLQVGSEDGTQTTNEKDSEMVDLELRLGHDSYSNY